MADKKNIVIIGGGIIGSSTAYFLSRHPKYNPITHSITLLEATKIAGGASGKAGGLLALWAYPAAIVDLSYRLHNQLADEHNGVERWGYRAVHCGQIDAKVRALGGPSVASLRDGATTGEDGGAINGPSVSLQKRSKDAIALLKRAGVPKDLDWVKPQSTIAYEEMGDPATTAQVHPYMFTTAIAELAEEKGVKIVYGSATSINTSQDGGVESVSYTSKDDNRSQTLPATDVVLAAGPWTQQIWPAAPISALRAHSVTIRPSRPVSAYALFTSIVLPKNFYKFGSTFTSSQGERQGPLHVTPEIYARPNNEVYACGEGDHLIPLPATSDLVAVDLQRCQDVVEYVSSISDELRDGEVTARQACYLPNVNTGGGPLIGKTSTKGLVLAAGHTCWGIQNGPGTGKLVAEIVFEGEAKSAKIKGGSLDPKMFGL
jgi:glycine/D-amino acid oxidase-like deaminating enzyme